MKKYKSILVGLLCLGIIISNLGPVMASKDSPQEIIISSKEDLKDLAEKSSLDSWSRGKSVILSKDLDLGNEEFDPIPIFSGSFDGQGHTIKGLNIKAQGKTYGFFRYLEKGAKVKNLRLEGKVEPRGDRSNIGGLVGHNKGTLENVSFKGQLKGKDSVGGLVGINGESGIISNSSVEGLVYGQTKVGGLVGFNTGTIINSRNEAKVNTTVEEDEETSMDLSFDSINISKLTSDSMDIGGVAGLNTGVIKNSRNLASIGYPSRGYNIGGIAGRQSGYISQVVNEGQVYGRKDVGGIVGQMEPYIKTVIPPSKLEELREELKNLQTYMTRLIDSSESSSREISESFLEIEKEIGQSQVHLESLVGQTEDLINKDIEEINRINLIALESMGKLGSLSDSLLRIMEKLKEAEEPLKKSLTHISKAMGQLSSFSEEYKILSQILDKLEGDMDQVKESLARVLADLEKGRIIIEYLANESILGDLIGQLIQGQLSIDEFLDRLNSEVIDLEALREILEAIKEGELSGEKGLGMIIELLSEDLYRTLDSALKNLKDSGTYLRDFLEKLEAGRDNIYRIIDSLGGLGREMKDGLDYLVQVIDIIEGVEEDLTSIGQGINELLKYLSSQEALEFETTDEEYQKTREDLFASMTRVNKSLGKLVKEVDRQNTIVMDKLQKLSDQLFKVMDLFFSLLEDLSMIELDPGKKMEDVSGEDIDKAREGKVENSRNLARIEGDLNVGGIAGAMGIEFEFDPEEDLNLKSRIPYDAVFQTRVLILNGKNQGDIIGKKDGVGAIVGSQDLGYIKNVQGEGRIQSRSGNYVGGIVGQSKGPIVDSYAKVELQGGDYVGGIAGKGREILNSYSMVNIRSANAYLGAIAGDLDNNNRLEENYFVSDSLRGVDGISYEKKAAPLAYEELIAREDSPEIFKEFKLEFWADNKLIKSLDFKYGDILKKEDLPDLPQKEGYYGQWEDLDEEKLIFDRKINGIYNLYISLLASEEKRDEALSLLLVEGKFKEEDRLGLEKKKPLKIKDQEALEVISLSIPDDGGEEHTLRYYPPKDNKNLQVYLSNGEDLERVKTRWDGKYIVFKAPGRELTMAVIDGGSKLVKYLILASMILLGLGLFIGIFKKKRPKKDPARA